MQLNMTRNNIGSQGSNRYAFLAKQIKTRQQLTLFMSAFLSFTETTKQDVADILGICHYNISEMSAEICARVTGFKYAKEKL